MTTKIYPSYSAFLARENKDENGVSPEFAEANPEYEKQNEKNSRCYDCYDCSRCSGCSGCSRCYGCYGCSDCYGCSRSSDCYGCFGCYGCYGCSGCYDCSGCSRCSDCYGCSGKKQSTGTIPKAPKIKNIHSKILAAVEKPGALDMSTWHTCETTHCRAGWAVVVAGERGRKLEEATSTLFAAMQIYHASSPVKVSPVRFFEKNKEAMADMKRCAAEEMKSEAIT